MHFSQLLTLAATLSIASVTAQINTSNAAIRDTCNTIKSRFSSRTSEVLTLRGFRFNEAISHWIKTSEQTPFCVVQPASAEDLSVAIRAIGQNRVPFAVQSGGHTSNPGFSSTRGVHISLLKLNEVTLSPDGSFARVGFGNTWADVYQALEGSGRNVNGGRVPGPGVGGFTLGGGYTWKTNTFGLTIDTVKSFTLVLPNGEIVTVDDSTPDLFFALRGGSNRFGVVASAEFYTHAQVPLVYGGTRLYAGSQVDAIINATAEFEATNRDPKATVITSILGPSSVTTQFFYDGPEKPASFQVFDGIKTLLIDTVKTQKFSEFINSIPSGIREPVNVRGYWESFCTTGLTLPFMQALRDEAERISKLPRIQTAINFVVDAYIPGLFGSKAAGNTAYPSDSQFPVLFDLAWKFPTDDAYWRGQLRQSRETLKAIARSEGILHPISYSNYVAADTPSAELFGAENAARLARIRNEVDPQRVMDLTGGFQL